MARRGLIGIVALFAAGCVEASNVIECDDTHSCPQGLVCEGGACVVDGPPGTGGWTSSYPAGGLQVRWAVAADLDGDGADELAIADGGDAGAGLWILRPLHVGEVPLEGGAGWPATRIVLGAVPWRLTSTPKDHLGEIFAGDLVTVSTLDDPDGTRATGAAVIGLPVGGEGPPRLLAQSFSLGTISVGPAGVGLDAPFFAMAALGASGPPQLVAGNLHVYDHRSFDPLGGGLGEPTPLDPGVAFDGAIWPISTGPGRFVIGSQGEVHLFESSLQSFQGRTALLPDGGDRWWSWTRVEAGTNDWALALAVHGDDAHVSAAVVPPDLPANSAAPALALPAPTPIANVTNLAGPVLAALWGVDGARDDLAFVSTTAEGQQLHVLLDLDLSAPANPGFTGEPLTGALVAGTSPVVAVVGGHFREAGGDQLELVRADGSLNCIIVSEASEGGPLSLTTCLP